MSEQTAKERTYNFPVFDSQGGGLVREEETVNRTCVEGTVIENRTYEYFFVEVPEGFRFAVGDKMPTEWDVVPANGLVQDLISQE